MAATAHLLMRIVQHNCLRNYAVCQAIFQAGVDIGAEILCLQDTYFGEKGMAHPAYIFRFGNMGKSRQQRVAAGVKIHRVGRMIVETCSDLIKHLYICVMDI